MKFQVKTSLLVLLVIVAFSMVACDDGGAEKVGKKIDHAFDTVKDKIHDATD